ncbi:MAG TPA: lysylphosphatidylglycerol synthase transmembrane domain-containing protein [Planctomycetota bacterium]|nr:lysylphosphatidylglycerol synthase transmembrane domain-containing protein [Planctomycetota bacterium]
MSPGIRKTAILAVKLAAAGGILAWLIASRKLTVASFAGVREHLWLLAGCAGLLFLLPLLGAMRWRLLLGAQGFEVTYRRTLHLGLVGVLFNTVGVGYVGGDVVKAYYAACDQPKGRRAEAVTSVVFDRFLGLAGLLLFAALAMALNPQAIWMNPAHPELRVTGWGLLGACAALAAIFLMASSPRLWSGSSWQRRVEKLPAGAILLRVCRAVSAYRSRPGTVAAGVAISFAAHSVNIAFLWGLSQALEFPPIRVVDFAFCLAVGLAVSSVGLPLGIGFGQAAFGYMFSLYLGDPGYTCGAALATLQQAFMIAFNLAVGLPAFLLVKKDAARVRAEMAADAPAGPGAAP